LKQFINNGKKQNLRNKQAFCVANITDNHKVLTKAIVTLLADPNLHEEMGDKGVKAILNGYTWEHNAMRVEMVLESVTKRNE